MSYTAYIDGGARGNPGPAAAGVYITDASGQVIFSGGLFLGHQTNNEAEYAGLVCALDLLKAAGAERIRICSDSELLVRQIRGQYRVKASNLKPLYERASAVLAAFKQYKLEHVPREHNKQADSLVNQALDAATNVIPIDKLNLFTQIRPPVVAATPAERSGPFGKPHHSASTPAHGSSRVATNLSAAGNAREVPSVGMVSATVLKPPRSGSCPARHRVGQVFEFGHTVPAGLCVHACGAMIEAVLALQSVSASAAGPMEPITATCPQPDCGAVFQIKQQIR